MKHGPVIAPRSPVHPSFAELFKSLPPWLHHFFSPFFRLSLTQSFHLSDRLPFIHPLLHPFIHPSINPSVRPFSFPTDHSLFPLCFLLFRALHPFIHPPIHSSIHPSFISLLSFVQHTRRCSSRNLFFETIRSCEGETRQK